MHQSLDAAFQLDERAVIHNTDHLPLHTRADGIFLHHGMPGIRSELFHAQGNSLFFGVELEHNDFDFFAHLDDFGRMIDSTPGHIADMENAIDAAEIDKRSVASDVFNRALENNSFFKDL